VGFPRASAAWLVFLSFYANIYLLCVCRTHVLCNPTRSLSCKLSWHPPEMCSSCPGLKCKQTQDQQRQAPQTNSTIKSRKAATLLHHILLLSDNELPCHACSRTPSVSCFLCGNGHACLHIDCEACLQRRMPADGCELGLQATLCCTWTNWTVAFAGKHS
jgi:hypothetical protein